ncbi:MAG: T9SS type A sorting domain-containing protein [Bacteroidetes bacterium]|nr:T9SS type A sorting domain-containing protein [Bacteroidota bacterium]
MNNLKSFPVFGFLLMLFAVSLNCHAQSWQWATSCGKGMYDDYATIASDKAGNTYMTGKYSGMGVFGHDTLVSGALGGPYLPVMFCKIDPSGTFQWVKGITGPEYSGAFASVAMNKNIDNIYFYGQYIYNVSIGGNYFQSNTVNIFLARYDPDGNCIWATQAGGSGHDYAEKACVDNDGNIFIAGSAYGTAAFDSITIGPGNYIAKYNAQGKCQWARSIGDESFYTCGMATNGSQVILAGKATVNTPFNFDSFVLDPSESPIFAASIDANGTTQWAKIEGNGPINGIINTGIDNNNNFYISGDCGADFIFGNDTIINHTGGMQFYLVKFDYLGNPIWVRASSGNGNNWVEPAEMTFGINNNIYITGYISFSGIENPASYFGNCSVTAGDSPMNVVMFIVGYDDNGNCIGVNQALTDYAQTHSKGGTSVAVDSNGYCIVAGQFRNATNFGPDTLTSNGERDIFVAKYGPFYGFGVEERKPGNQLVIYANPNDGKCTVILPGEFRLGQHLVLTIYNNLGMVVQQMPVDVNADTISLDLSDKPRGIYNALLSDGRMNFSEKIIINK